MRHPPLGQGLLPPFLSDLGLGSEDASFQPRGELGAGVGGGIGDRGLLQRRYEGAVVDQGESVHDLPGPRQVDAALCEGLPGMWVAGEVDREMEPVGSGHLRQPQLHRHLIDKPVPIVVALPDDLLLQRVIDQRRITSARHLRDHR